LLVEKMCISSTYPLKVYDHIKSILNQCLETSKNPSARKIFLSKK